MGMERRSIEDVDDGVLASRVLVRVDFNVPLEGGRVADDTRIRATLPTLRYLLDRDARIVLMSHLGRPKGERKEELSLAPVADRLGELLEAPVRFVADVAGEDSRRAVEELGAGEVLLLENVRFSPGEEANDPGLSESLAALGDVYVNDAFGSAHRAHASTSGVAEVMSREGRPAVAGLLMVKELRFLGMALERPERPFVTILGGAKISGKIDVIESLLPRVDRLLIGGAMANTFFRALGLETGRSLVEEDRVQMAGELLERAGERLVLPVDCRVAAEAESGVAIQVVERSAVPEEMSILDIGPGSVALFTRHLDGARTVVWNGPMGMFEVAGFERGTLELARVLADRTEAGATTIVGGGDTAAAVEKAGIRDRVTHVSTGGGASLEFLEGRVLPGVAALNEESHDDG